MVMSVKRKAMLSPYFGPTRAGIRTDHDDVA
jgi:hypothetical protein